MNRIQKQITIDKKIFKKGIKNIFRIYDEDNSGFLEKEEFRSLLDDCREAMFLPKADDHILTLCMDTLDSDGNKQIE